MDQNESVNISELAADIVSAFVSKNSVTVDELTTLIANVHRALQAIQTGEAHETASPATAKQNPAVPIKKSVTPDYIISLEDGVRYKSLKRHLATKHGLTPQAYREKWGLPRDYPMVAPNYSDRRSSMAKILGLGRKQIEVTAKRSEKSKAA